ncbi:MAG: hypothetical protein ACD_75C02636G0002 [uncultured bacterium]|nr:MAG: hypothetical protein ACD_75C02636G0002 [uncultured bacterium]
MDALHHCLKFRHAIGRVNGVIRTNVEIVPHCKERTGAAFTHLGCEQTMGRIVSWGCLMQCTGQPEGGNSEISSMFLK